VKTARGLDATLIKGSGGQFEVVYEGRLIFSKKELGRFPDTDEILSKLPA
jgi:selenoprotein W-related protein